jgi:hypothetical protein
MADWRICRILRSFFKRTEDPTNPPIRHLTNPPSEQKEK